jgi:phospholipase C
VNADQAIRHVVLLVLENHSFDQMVGCLQDVFPDLDGVALESEAPRFNLDLAGNKVFQSPTDALQVERDPKHETANVLDQLAGGNAGFVRDYERNVPGVTADDKRNLMGYYLLDRLPALHQLGRNFTVCDRWFSSVPGPTWPNRFFVLSGTSSGRILMPEGLKNPRPGEFVAQDQVTLFDRLNEAGRSWRIYFYDFPVSLLFNHQRHARNLAGYSPIKHFYADVLHEETFPDFVFIEPKYLGADQNDDHPPHNVMKAEKLIADVYNAIRSSPALWESTLFIVTYDEHGGFYDHVPPPPAVQPDGHNEEWTFDRLGVRVPTILISPWVGARVEKTQFDHTSLLQYLRTKWQLGPLGLRTEAANNIAVALTEPQPREDTVPFIRVPYTDLIPEKVELEERDLSRHHQAIHSFAAFLAKAEGAGSGELIDAIAHAARWWVRIKELLGVVFNWIGKLLIKDSDLRRKHAVTATVNIARKRIAMGDTENGGPGQPVQPSVGGGVRR